jgi:hypothetical protein
VCGLDIVTSRSYTSGDRRSVPVVLRLDSFHRLGPDSTAKLTRRAWHPGTALIFFVLSLLKRLQSLGSVPAIVYDEYSRSLGAASSMSSLGAEPFANEPHGVSGRATDLRTHLRINDDNANALLEQFAMRPRGTVPLVVRPRDR